MISLSIQAAWKSAHNKATTSPLGRMLINPDKRLIATVTFDRGLRHEIPVEMPTFEK
jgi:hypothetical protein